MYSDGLTEWPMSGAKIQIICKALLSIRLPGDLHFRVRQHLTKLYGTDAFIF
jgi:hypothetical protein